jgi:TRAP-type C4-dicarboxylate transport system permease small subunit
LKEKKGLLTKIQLYSVYLLFLVLILFILVMGVKSFLDFYSTGWITLKITKRGINDNFGPHGGAIAIILVGHVSFVWLFVLFYYNMILDRLNRRVRAFTVDVREVSNGY